MYYGEFLHIFKLLFPEAGAGVKTESNLQNSEEIWRERSFPNIIIVSRATFDELINQFSWCIVSCNFFKHDFLIYYCFEWVLIMISILGFASGFDFCFLPLIECNFGLD